VKGLTLWYMPVSSDVYHHYPLRNTLTAFSYLRGWSVNGELRDRAALVQNRRGQPVMGWRR
jgi:hypothetical protein